MQTYKRFHVLYYQASEGGDASVDEDVEVEEDEDEETPRTQASNGDLETNNATTIIDTPSEDMEIDSEPATISSDR